MLHLVIRKYTSFSRAHGMFVKIQDVAGCKASLNVNQRTAIILAALWLQVNSINEIIIQEKGK